MKTITYFKNKNFKSILVILLISLISINTYNYYNGIKNALIPGIVQIIILLFILSKHRSTKLVLKYWSVIFMIIAPLITIISKTIKFFIVEPVDTELYKIIQAIITILIGYFIYEYTTKTLEIIEVGNGTD